MGSLNLFCLFVLFDNIHHLVCPNRIVCAVKPAGASFGRHGAFRLINNMCKSASQHVDPRTLTLTLTLGLDLDGFHLYPTGQCCKLCHPGIAQSVKHSIVKSQVLAVSSPYNLCW